MSTVLNRTTKELIESANTPDYSPDEWIINPDMSAVAGLPPNQWVIDGDTVSAGPPPPPPPPVPSAPSVSDTSGAFVAADTTQWAGTPPATLQAAINRIAARIGTDSPIP
jgi:hypothetical protein